MTKLNRSWKYTGLEERFLLHAGTEVVEACPEWIIGKS